MSKMNGNEFLNLSFDSIFECQFRLQFLDLTSSIQHKLSRSTDVPTTNCETSPIWHKKGPHSKVVARFALVLYANSRMV